MIERWKMSSEEWYSLLTDSQFCFRFLFILLEQKAEFDLEELDKFREGHFEGLWFKGYLQSTAQHKGRLTKTYRIHLVNTDPVSSPSLAEGPSCFLIASALVYATKSKSFRPSSVSREVSTRETTTTFYLSSFLFSSTLAKVPRELKVL